MGGLSLTLLGEFTATLDGVPIEGFRTRSAQALLIYLAVQEQRQRREHLMTLLWPDLPQAAAQQNLRQNLYLMRQTINLVPARTNQTEEVPLILGDREYLQLNPEAAVQVDALRLETILDKLSPTTSELAEAVDLYRGSFLADFYLPQSSEFEEWALACRQQYRQSILDALTTLVDLALETGDVAQAESYLRRQLAIEPLAEAANRRLIELLARTDRRMAAISHFQTYQELLERDVHVPPGPETVALIDLIRAGDVPQPMPESRPIRGYEVKEELGRSAYATVYRALQTTVGRDVALKIISARYADNLDFIRRFEAEAQMIARLEHPHIIPLYDYWREPGGAFLVMRYLRGGDLRAALEGEPLPVDSVVRVLQQIAAALQEAHDKGIVHCDVKPGNILLDEQGNAFLADFGIAQLIRADSTSESGDFFLGTPDYISPEQVRSEPVNSLADQYSLGMVMYELLSGKRPYETESLTDLLQKHLSKPLASVHLQRPDLSSTVDDVLWRATAKDPDKRYPDITAFARALREALVPDGKQEITPDAVLPLRNPYKGLAPFDEADVIFFYGREAMTARLVKRLAEEIDGRQFLAVVGPSGSGKSSLVRAGLLPELRAGALPGSDGWFYVQMQVGSQPFAALEAALVGIAVHSPGDLTARLRAGPHGLCDAVRLLLPADSGHQLVLIIDQFEELFTLGDDPAEVDAFLSSLAEAVTDPDCPLRLILTLRADFFDRPLRHKTFSGLLQERTELVVPLSPDELMRAIAQPPARVGVGVEAALVGRLVAELSDQPGALPLLQYTLGELFERREQDNLTLAAYEELGGIHGALSLRAEAVYESLSPEEKEATHALFSRLVTLRDYGEVTKRRALLEEIMSIDQSGAGTVSRESISAAVTAFGTARLLSFDRDPATRGSTVELAHEALLAAWPRLSHWLDLDRATIRLERLLTQATDDWLGSGEDEGFLLREARLDQLASLEQSGIALTEDERRFLEASLAARNTREAAEESRRAQELQVARSLAQVETARAAEQADSASRLRILAVGLTVALVVAGVAAVSAFFFARDSERNAQVAATREVEAVRSANLAATREVEALSSAQLATSRELSQAATALLQVDPELSLLLALAAVDQSPTKEAEEALHQALQSVRTVKAFSTGAEGHFGALLAVAPDGRRVATPTDNEVIIWDLASGEPLQMLPLTVPTSEHYELRFSPGGDQLMLLSGSPSQTSVALETWDLLSLESTGYASLPVSVAESDHLAMSPDGRLVATVSESGLIELWDVETRQRLVTLRDSGGALVDLAFTGDGQYLFAAERNGLVEQWNVPASLRLSTPALGGVIDGSASAQSLGGLAHIAAVGDELLALGYLGGVEIWSLSNTDRPRFVFREGTNLTREIAVSPDGSQLLVGGQEGVAQVWDLETGEHLLMLAQHESPIDDLAFIPGGARAVSIDREGVLRVWDSRPQRLGEILSISVDPAMIDLALSPDERQIALGHTAGPAAVWDIQTGQRLLTLPGDFGGVYRVDYSDDGERLAAAGSDNKVRIWDVRSGDLLLTIEGHEEGIAGGLFPGVMDVSFSPDGQRLATAGADGLAHVWDALSGERLFTLEGHSDALHSLAWSPDGRTIATTSDENDTSVRLWDAATGELLHTLTGHVVRVWGVAFSPDSETLVTGGARGIIKAWDVATGRNLYTVIDEGDHIGTVAFTPDGEHFVTTGEVPLRVRRAVDGVEVVTLSAPMLWSAQVSSDGRWLYAGDVDGVVRVFALELAETIELAEERLTRWWEPDECARYLHQDTCPESPSHLAGGGG